MAHEIEPLSIPRQHARPHLEGLIRPDLAAETTRHGAEHDVEGAFLLRIQLGAGAVHAELHQAGGQVQAADVEVAEVGAVGLVDVVVALEQGAVGGDDHGLEEGGGPGAVRPRRDVSEDAVEEADLLGVPRLSAGWAYTCCTHGHGRSQGRFREGMGLAERRHTCHAKGRLFRLSSAKTIASSRHTEPGWLRSTRCRHESPIIAKYAAVMLETPPTLTEQGRSQSQLLDAGLMRIRQLYSYVLSTSAVSPSCRPFLRP